jgi:hypothetical protein
VIGAYCFDTSGFMDGWVRHYPYDVFPDLWNKMDGLIGNGTIISSTEVFEEIKKKDDDLSKWMNGRKSMLVDIDDNTQIIITEILAKFPKFVDSRSNRNGADPWVIALAIANKGTVVTGEIAPGKEDRPTIPFVCQHFQVPYMGLLGFMREQKWVFKLR